ncbi:adenosylcobinamide-GDP ribazoletransferase [Allosalinactinospora lopnorensis]|uniref:adenosylcobinamide-GDP ribazoletransferase n=1 Tax=Allosalinactinospora lopnorensis TaxID=1352348 RepID=UPI000623D517|nr:adenosylcobinamide-GDP ribazoletransferase [Allosalinactinospora lopnorensis]
MLARDAADGLRMAGGTFTVVPVRAARIDRGVAGWAMALAPLIGTALGALAALLLVLAGAVGLGPLPASALAVGLLAVLTRGLHLDGLADLADGLGSARPAAGALDIMRRSDIGPFGVITLVLSVLIQVLALGELASASPVAGAAGLVTAVIAGRLAITCACTPRIPAARPDGLGSLVARSVHYWAAAAASAGTGLAALGGLAHGAGFALACLLAVAAGLAAAGLLLRHAVSRLGGITGDVLGALSETATATALVVMAAAV